MPWFNYIFCCNIVCFFCLCNHFHSKNLPLIVIFLLKNIQQKVLNALDDNRIAGYKNHNVV